MEACSNADRTATMIELHIDEFAFTVRPKKSPRTRRFTLPPAATTVAARQANDFDPTWVRGHRSDHSPAHTRPTPSHRARGRLLREKTRRLLAPPRSSGFVTALGGVADVITLLLSIFFLSLAELRNVNSPLNKQHVGITTAYVWNTEQLMIQKIQWHWRHEYHIEGIWDRALFKLVYCRLLVFRYSINARNAVLPLVDY